MSGLALFFMLALAPAPAPAPVAENPHFDAAVAAWKDERWSDAADAFARAYASDPRPEYVFARAQALRFSGECEGAIAGYREFIALDPPEGAIAEAREHIATCGGDPDATSTPPASEPEPGPAVPPRVAAPRPIAPPADTSPRAVEPAPRPWWKDPAGHVLGWTGLAAAGVGTGFMIEGLARRDRGARATDEQAYRDARRGGASLLHAGIPLVSIGGALVLGSMIRFAVVARGRRPRARESAVWRALSPSNPFAVRLRVLGSP